MNLPAHSRLDAGIQGDLAASQNVLYFSSSALEGNTAQSIQMIYMIGAEPTTISNARQFKVGFVYIIIT